MKKFKRILSFVLVGLMLVTQDASHIYPVFANEKETEIGEEIGVEETSVETAEEETTVAEAGSHPQEGSFGETHPNESAETTTAAETTTESETTVEEAGSQAHPYENAEESKQANSDESETAAETTVEAEAGSQAHPNESEETTTAEAGSQAHPYESDETTVEEETTTVEESSQAASNESETEISETEETKVATDSEIDVANETETLESTSETLESIEESIASISEIVETSEIEIASPSEVADIVEEIATPSELISVATISEMSAMTFEMQLTNQNAKFTKNENEYILNEDLSLTDTLNVHEEIILNLNSHKITAPENGSAIYIENSFTLKGTINDEQDEMDYVQGIIGTNYVYPVIDAKNAKVYLNNGTIKASNGGVALHVEDTDVEINGAVLMGGNGESYETRRGDDGGDAVQIIFNDTDHTFKFNYGVILGGNGGNGIGKEFPNPGAALKMMDTAITTEKLLFGAGGEKGGGNGGHAINVLKTTNGRKNIIIDGLAINAGNAGLNLDFDEKDIVYKATNLPTAYDLRNKDGKNYLTKLKNQGNSGWCARFTAIAGAETDLIVNYRDYLEKNGYNVEKTLNKQVTDVEADKEIDLSEPHLGIYDQYQAMDAFGNAGLSYDVVSTSDPKYVKNGQTDSALSSYLSTWRDVYEEKVKPWSSRTSYPDNLTNASSKEKVTDRPFAVMTNSKIVDFTGKSNDTDATYKAAQKTFISKLKQAIVDGSGAKIGIQIYQGEDWTKTNVEYKGENYYAFNLSREKLEYLKAHPVDGFGGHAMYAMGWDDNFPKEKFGHWEDNITSNGAILVKNSWGCYTWITYEYAFTNGAYNVMDFIPSNNYENIYYYDGGTGYSTYTFSGDPYQATINGTQHIVTNQYNIIANSFVIKNDQEKIRAISYNSRTEASVEISIFKANADTEAAIKTAAGGTTNGVFQGTALFKKSMTINAGTTFVPLDTPIDAKKGEVYFVVVDYKNSSMPYIYVDEVINDYDEIAYTTPANHSYVFSTRRRLSSGSVQQLSTDKDWHTVSNWFNKYNKTTAYGNKNLNFRIKLITNNYITLDAGNGYFDDDNTKTKDYKYLNIEDAYGDLKKPTSKDPKKEFSHYDFDGKYNNGDAIDVESTTEYVPEYAKAKVLYAIYKDKPTHTITFDAGEGNMPSGQKTLTFYQGEDKTLIQVDYTKDGFKLDSWTNSETGASVALDANVKTFEGKDITLIAKWVSTTAPSYTINFDANGGDMPTGLKTQTYLENESKILITVDYTREAYELTGWTRADNNAKVALDANVNTLGNKDLTLKAVWTKLPTYTITFDTNGGTAPTGKKTMTYYKNEDKTLISVDYKRAGYTLDAWIRSDNNATVALDANVNTLDNKNLTLKASWVALPTYTITFKGGDGATPTDQKTLTYYQDESKTLTKYTYTKVGFKHVGWTREDNGADVAFDANVNTFNNQNVTLIAKWEALKKYLITFEPGDEEAEMPTGKKTQEFYEGDTTQLIKVDYKLDGKTIGYWTRQDTGAKVNTTAKVNTLVGNYDSITLVAYWQTASQGVLDGGGRPATTGGSSSGSRSGGRISAGSIGLNTSNQVTSAGPGVMIATNNANPLSNNQMDNNAAVTLTTTLLNSNVVIPNIDTTKTGNEQYVTRASYNPVQGTSDSATTYSNGKWQLDSTTNTWNYKVELAGHGEVKAVGWVNDVAFNASANANETHKYYFDNDGQMVAGFITDSYGNTYYMDETEGANLGRMVTGPKMIDGYMRYFFDNGVMLKNYTLDGHVIDSEGRFIS